MKNLSILPFLLFAFSACQSEPSTSSSEALELKPEVKEKALAVLRQGLKANDFWSAIHAAEGLTLAGHGDEVIAFLKPKLGSETDDQHLCGIARELISELGDWA